MFLRKVDSSFPNDTLKKYIMKDYNNSNNNLIKRKNKLFYIENKLRCLMLFQRILQFKNYYFSLFSFFTIAFFFTKMFMNSQ
jgi:hypothetical protein